MNKSDFFIDIALQDNGCGVISPWHRYTTDEFDIAKDRIARNLENLAKLENTISERMKVLYQKNISEILEKEVPIMYLDCDKKGNDDIMFFLFKECMKNATMENKEQVASKIIGRRTIVTPDSDTRNKYMKENQLDLEWMFNYYNEQLKTHLSTNDSEYINSLLNYEGNMAFDWLGKLMEHQKTRYLYLYLDKVEKLSIDEQTRINRFLYSRWAINNDKWVRLKINNWSKWWKSRTSDSWHRVEATHDYSERHIYEEDL